MDADGHANNSMVGEGETEQETDKTRQIEELVPKWSSTSVAWMWFDCENLIQTRKLYSASHDNRLKHHEPLLPPTQELLDREYGQSFTNDKHKKSAYIKIIYVGLVIIFLNCFVYYELIF